MCLLCVSIAKENITGKEFISNFVEMGIENMDEQHIIEIGKLIDNASIEFRDNISNAIIELENEEDELEFVEEDEQLEFDFTKNK